MQATFLDVLDQFGEIGLGVELADDLLEAGATAHGEIERFRVLIPLVGAFNAGKTTLVNAYLQREHGSGLPTDIVPQTALATEIYAAPSAQAERVELMGDDGAVLREVGLEEFGQVEKQTLKSGELEAQYAKAHLHHADLPDSNRKVLVDMPGLDSGLRTHNAAIQRYLPRGGYFFMVVDAEHGTLRQSEIDQLREFLAQEVDFTVLVNKIDKKKTDAEAIVAHIKDQVRQEFEKPASVCAVSAADNDVAAFRDTLAAVDFDHALRGFWRGRVVGLIDDAIESLHTRYSALNVSTAESDRVIEDLESKEETLREKLREDERDVRNRYSRRSVDRNVRAVRDAIGDAAPSLADTYLQGGKDAGDREINELVRQTLNRTVSEETADTMQRIAENYTEEIGAINAEYNRFATSAELPQAPNQRIGTALVDAGRRSADALARAPDTIKRDTVFSTVAGVLAVSTSVVAPWLEVIIIALPLIYRFFSEKQAREQQAQQQERQRQELPMRIRSTVAPRIASELRTQVEADYAGLAQQMLSDLRQQVEAKIGRIRADINKSQAEIAAAKEDLQSRKDALRTAIDGLAALKTRTGEQP